MDVFQIAIWTPRCRAATVMSMATTTLTPGIAALAGDISTVVRSDAPAIDIARDVAGVLTPALARPGLLAPEHRQGRPERYMQHVLYVDPECTFSIVSLVWMPGQHTVIHDHISWCVVGVHTGVEEETLYRFVDNGREPAHLVRTGHNANIEGATSYFAPPGDIHSVCNSSAGKVISIHVYGADVSTLGSSVRRSYDLPVRG
jgi:predicted metal-dependent enzyme (double-stranded beta helix superfamily)